MGNLGHTAANCFYRYGQSYMGLSLRSTSKGSISSGGHLTYFAFPNTVQDQSWYMDNGAINHVTHDSVNLDQVNNHCGKDKLIVGNGDRIDISKIGLTTFQCVNQQGNLKLKEVLHVPKIAKNLISVSRLTTDNDVLIEFDNSG